MTMPSTTGQERYQYFPMSFHQGQSWFEEAVKAAGGHHERHILPGIKGPHAEELSIGFGWIGRPKASRVYLSICGTHGQEYPCGAAGQLAWLHHPDARALPDEIAVCFIHALNPFGAAHHSRANADFIDLNRNYRDMSVPMRVLPLFQTVASALQTKTMDHQVFYEVIDAFNALLKTHDKAAVMDALAGGQSEDPTSIMYAGNALSWEVRTLQSLLQAHFQHAQKVALIDWHTGLGAQGTATVIHDFKPGSTAYESACKWWGQSAETSALYDAGVEPDLVGLICNGAADTLRAMGADVIQTVIELGTVNNDAIIPAFLIDRWLRFECADPRSPQAVELRTIMMERYCPTLPSWRSAVLSEMGRLYRNTLEGLAAW